MIEAYAIIATLAAGSGWLLYWDKAREVKEWRKAAFYEFAVADSAIVEGWEADDIISELKAQLQDAQATTTRQADCIGGLQSRLQEIADQETTSANATVKRMAAIARREA